TADPVARPFSSQGISQQNVKPTPFPVPPPPPLLPPRIAMNEQGSVQANPHMNSLQYGAPISGHTLHRPLSQLNLNPNNVPIADWQDNISPSQRRRQEEEDRLLAEEKERIRLEKEEIARKAAELEREKAEQEAKREEERIRKQAEEERERKELERKLREQWEAEDAERRR
ncbi:14164_t:CDS:1, partial [Acaulospora colombiana]